MARRTLNEIQSSLLSRKESTASLSALEVLTDDEKQTLSNLTSNSKVALWRLWVYIMSFAIWLHEGIFETHKIEIEELIALNKIHTALWYKGKALDFQFGFNLQESDIYDNTGVEESDVIDSKIIKQASVEEVIGTLKIKVAKEDINGDLSPLEASEISAFTQYMQLIKDAGTRLDIISRNPDDIKLEIDIYFNPLVLDAIGQRLDGNNDEPVKEAIETFLYNLEFNGEFIMTKLVDFLQTVEGVEMPVIKSAETKFAGFSYSEIGETYIADSGYMVLDEAETTINYIARELL